MPRNGWIGGEAIFWERDRPFSREGAEALVELDEPSGATLIAPPRRPIPNVTAFGGLHGQI